MILLIRKTNERVPHQRRFLWLVECSVCGHQFTADKPKVTRGERVCPKCPRARPNFRNYKGQVVNETVSVINEAGVNSQGCIIWNAVCLLCGTPFQLDSSAIRRGTFSCGCWGKQQNRIRALNKYKGD